MDQLIQFSQKFGSLINFGLLLSIVALYFKVHHQTITQLKEHISLLKDKLEDAEKKTIPNASDVMNKTEDYFKNYYKISAEEWLKKSIEQLETEKAKSIKDQEESYTQLLNEEIESRKNLAKENEKLISKLERYKPRPPLDLVGQYTISGKNPDMYREYAGGMAKKGGSYFGKLQIFLPEHIKTFIVRWEITSSKEVQEHIGTGVLVGNVLSVVFNSNIDENDKEPPGLTSYEMIGDKILRGKWTVHGEDFFGTEECRKVS